MPQLQLSLRRTVEQNARDRGAHRPKSQNRHLEWTSCSANAKALAFCHVRSLHPCYPAPAEGELLIVSTAWFEICLLFDNRRVLPARDSELLRILDNALQDSCSRGRGWLACRPGCSSCCHGVFRISALDALRLRQALDSLPDRAQAEAICARARAFAAVLAPSFPGDAVTGLLHEQDESWERFADLPEADAACPVLDPASGRCELYAARPLTCRIFGPPVRGEDGIGMCELCYVGAPEAEVLAGELHLAHGHLEQELDRELAARGITGETIIPWALLARSL